MFTEAIKYIKKKKTSKEYWCTNTELLITLYRFILLLVLTSNSIDIFKNGTKYDVA